MTLGKDAVSGSDVSIFMTLFKYSWVNIHPKSNHFLIALVVFLGYHTFNAMIFLFPWSTTWLSSQALSFE
jgi:uncharacterized membrane protein